MKNQLFIAFLLAPAFVPGTGKIPGPGPASPMIPVSITTTNPLPYPNVFNAAVFEQSVANKMKNKSKGFAFAIGNKDGILGKSAGGWAQDPADGNLPMTSKTPSCTGSTIKMVSSTALLNLLEANPSVRLDDAIFPKLPKKWREKYKNTRVECITYRQLLMHKSGFRSGSDVKNLDSASGFAKTCPFTSTRRYNNTNISLLRYLITSLAYPSELPGIEEKLEGLNFTDYSTKANIEFSYPYERYVRKFILDKGLVKIEAGCQPDEFGNKVAKGYSDRLDTKGGFIKEGEHCAPQGSWFMSAEMMVHFGRTLLYSNNFLTTTTRNMLFDPAKTDDRLGWANFDTDNDFGTTYGQSNWPWHDGAQNGYFALIMQLPNGCVGAAMVNSSINLDTDTNPVSTVPFLINVLTDAFREAMQGGPVAEVAKHGVAESSYQEEFNLLSKGGYYPVWVDGYDVSGKTYFNIIMRPNTNNYGVVARHDLTPEAYQQEYNEWVKQKGFRLENLDNYNDAGKIKIAAVFVKKPGAPVAQPSYHVLSQTEHQDLFEKYSKEGYVPVNVSVVSIGGKLYYSAFYEKRNVGDHVLRSTLTQEEYQNLYDEMKGKKWEQVYINAYHHEKKTRFSVIWYEYSGYQSLSATRRASGDVYQDLWQTNTGKGLLTRCVTGYDEGGKHWFAAEWAK